MSQQYSLIPLGPQGQILYPVSFLIYLLTLPIRIITELIGHVSLSPAQPTQIQSLVHRVPFPYLMPTEQPLTKSNVIEASYTVREVPSQPVLNYVNEESWEIERDEEGLAKRIIVHRNAQRT